MTVRKAQGATLDYVVLYFDLFQPNPRGFAYVGASRVRRASGLYYFGVVRQSDWLPVGGPGAPMEHDARGPLSVDGNSSDEEDYDAENEWESLSSRASCCEGDVDAGAFDAVVGEPCGSYADIDGYDLFGATD